MVAPEDLFGATLDAADTGLAVLARDGSVVCWNRWLALATGISAENAHGKTFAEIFPRGNLDRVLAAIAAALEAGSSTLLTHALHPHLFPLHTRAGQPLLHDVVVSAVGPLPSTACLVQISDITMTAQRERILRERQNARYDALVASATDAILTLDGEGVIQLANPAAAQQFGYSTRELVDKKAADLFEIGHLWSDIWRTVAAGQKLDNASELVGRRKDGSKTQLEVSAARWRIDARIFVTAILRDVNERHAVEAALRASEAQARASAEALAELNATLEQRVEVRTKQLVEAEEALRQSHKMEAVGQLTGGIAHDFNNLLQGIIGALDRIKKRIAEGRIGDVDRFLTGAMESANRAATLTHRLLAFSRRQPVDPRPIDVNQLIASVEELLRRSIGESIKMNITGADDLWLVRCDANQLENALLNLAINARDAMPNGGALTISTSNATLDATQALQRDVAPGEYVRLNVGDTGIGMPPDVRSRAFDPFYTTKPIGQGTGLGLSMIYGFVRQSDGAAKIHSEPGKGTTIEICLPRFRGGLEAVVKTDDHSGDHSAATDEVVLVVEDERVVRLLVVEVLSDLGYRALEAADGAAALRILHSSQRIDLLITDIGLPDINGRQVTDAARAKRPELKVLFMTGYAENAAGNAFLGKDMEIISKPFTMDLLAKRIREMIEDVPAQRQAG